MVLIVGAVQTQGELPERPTIHNIISRWYIFLSPFMYLSYFSDIFFYF